VVLEAPSSRGAQERRQYGGFCMIAAIHARKSTDQNGRGIR
jgi:hypothetical protein